MTHVTENGMFAKRKEGGFQTNVTASHERKGTWYKIKKHSISLGPHAN